MDPMMVTLRVIHILTGVFWAGAAFFMIRFLLPTVRVTGQEGGKFLTRMMTETGILTIIPVAATLTILSGIALYWKDSNGFEAAWMGSRTGMVFGVGAVTGILAALVAIHVTRPAGKKMVALSAEIAAGGGVPTPDQLARVQKLAGKMGWALRLTVILLVISILAMSAARYVWT